MVVIDASSADTVAATAASLIVEFCLGRRREKREREIKDLLKAFCVLVPPEARSL